MTGAQTAVPATVFAATPVLFDADGEIDVGTLHRLHAGLVGSSAAGPDTVIAHVGAASARQAVRLTRQTRRMGLTRLAAITPFYLRAERTEMLRYFSEIADVADGADLYVYAFEHVTNSPVPADLLAELAKLPGVRGVKLSGVAGTDLIREHVAATPGGFAALSGNDRELADVVRAKDAEAERAAAQRDVDAAVGLLGASAAALKTALSTQGYPATR